MQVGHRQGFHQGPGGFEVRSGLSREAHQNVQAQGRSGKPLVQLQDHISKIFRIVRASHGLQHRWGAALQGQVKMGTEMGESGQGLHQLRGNFLGFQGTEAHPERPVALGKMLEEAGQAGGGRQVLPILAQVNADEDHFLKAPVA